MKKLIFILNLALILPVFIMAQNIETIVNEKAIAIAKAKLPKGDVMEACSDLYMQYISENKPDSAAYILDYWQNELGTSELVFRGKVLLSLYSNTFDESVFSDENIKFIYSFRNKYSEETYYPKMPYYYRSHSSSFEGYYFSETEFDIFTQAMAKDIVPKYPDQSIENLIAQFYGGNTEILFSTLCNSDSYKESIIKQEFDKEIKQLNNSSELHYALIAGAWIPSGKLDILGVHPELGFQVGVKHKKMNYDLTILMRFLDAAHKYEYWDHNKEMRTTRHLFGAYFGFDLGRDIIIKGRHELQVVGGIAYDGIDVVPKNKKKDIESISVGSLNLNAGLSYRYYLSSGQYLGLRVKYNYLNYSRNKHFDYDGNAMSVHLVWGGLSSFFKKSSLNYFNQKFRD